MKVTDYVKRIQRRLNLKGIGKKRSELMDEIKTMGYDPENLSDESTDLISAYLLNKFIPSEKNNTDLFNSPTDYNPDTSNNLVEENKINKNNSPVFISDDENNSSEIIVSQDEKHELVVAQSSALAVQLSETETIELCNRIPDVFDDYEDFTTNVIAAIKSFVDKKFDHQEKRSANESVEELRQHIAARKAKLDSKFAEGLNTIGGDLEQMRSDIKSAQARILAHIKTC